VRAESVLTVTGANKSFRVQEVRASGVHALQDIIIIIIIIIFTLPSV
jgi:hypothetical protein